MSLVGGHVIHKEDQVPQTSHNSQSCLPNIIMKPLPLPQCNHNLSLLDAGQLAHHISSKTFVRTILLFHVTSKYFPHQYKLSGDYPSKPSTADTYHVQQLISSWKAGTAAQITKMIVDVKNKPLESYTIGFNLSQAELKAV